MVFIILAIYNEEKNIPQLVSDIRSALKKGEYKIIAVDDGSSDDSLRILRELKDDDIIIEHHKVNLSIGAVFSTGFNIALQQAKSDDDLVVVMESDQTSDVGLLKELIDTLSMKDRDICIASRYIKGGGYSNFPLIRRLYSILANNIMRYFFPIPGVRDYTIFYRCYRVKVLRDVMDFFGPYNFIHFRGFVSNSEILVKAACFTDKISEVPFFYNYGGKKGKSKLRICSNIFEYIYFIFSMRRIISSVRKVISHKHYN